MATQLASPLIPENVRTFMSDRPRYATVATINPDGSPHQIVVWFLLRGNELVINSRHGRRWPSNLRRDGRVNFAVYDGDDAVTIDAVVTTSYEGPAAQDDIAEMAVLYDTPEVAQGEIARFRTERRLSFVLRPVDVHIHGDPR